jgi:hypothetical protein
MFPRQDFEGSQDAAATPEAGVESAMNGVTREREPGVASRGDFAAPRNYDLAVGLSGNCVCCVYGPGAELRQHPAAASEAPVEPAVARVPGDCPGIAAALAAQTGDDELPVSCDGEGPRDVNARLRRFRRFLGRSRVEGGGTRRDERGTCKNGQGSNGQDIARLHHNPHARTLWFPCLLKASLNLLRTHSRRQGSCCVLSVASRNALPQRADAQR